MGARRHCEENDINNMDERRTWKMELSCTERLKSKETARKSKRNV